MIISAISIKTTHTKTLTLKALIFLMTLTNINNIPTPTNNISTIHIPNHNTKPLTLKYYRPQINQCYQI